MRLAILSDIHEDLPRLQKVVRKIEKKGYDLCICLGDISGFSKAYYRYDKIRNASACLEILRKKCEIIIPGNHDLHAVGLIPELPEGDGYEYWPHEEDLDPGYSEEEKAFLSGLPTYKILPNHKIGILLSHYAIPNISGFFKGIYGSGKEFKSHFQFMQENSCTLSFTGHTHVRGFYQVTSAQLRHYGYRSHILKDFPVIIGIPPVSRNNLRSGFCIFDTDNFHLQVIKLY